MSLLFTMVKLWLYFVTIEWGITVVIERSVQVPPPRLLHGVITLVRRLLMANTIFVAVIIIAHWLFVPVRLERSLHDEKTKKAVHASASWRINCISISTGERYWTKTRTAVSFHYICIIYLHRLDELQNDVNTRYYDHWTESNGDVNSLKLRSCVSFTIEVSVAVSIVIYSF